MKSMTPILPNSGEALASFQEALDFYPEDEAAQLQIKRVRKLQTQEFPEDWEGAVYLDKK